MKRALLVVGALGLLALRAWCRSERERILGPEFPENDWDEAARVLCARQGVRR